MNASQIIDQLGELDIGAVRQDEPLRRHTSFKIGGPARFFVEPESQSAVVRALNWVRDHRIPYFIIGQGTNILVSDQGLNAVVISTARGLKSIAVEAPYLSAGSGVLLTKLAHTGARAGLTGLEFALSIPGTLGGALVMNAGAHGSSMVAVVDRVTVWDPIRGVREIPASEAEFEYRKSRFQKTPWIALEASLELSPGDPVQIREAMRHYMAYRLQSQPVGEANAGSIFKNPLPEFAGRLIEGIGAKGWRENDAEVSSLHANFIINRGGAKAIDVLRLMRRIRCVVYHATGVILRPEVRWIGPGEGGTNTIWDNLWYAEGEGLREPCE